MRSAILLAGLLLGLATTADARPQARRLFLTTNYEESRWCAFSSRAPAEASAEENFGLTLVDATVASNGAITRLTVVWGPESGDWAVTDTYRLKGVETDRVDRVIGDASGRPVRQTFARRSGRLVASKTTGGPAFVPDAAPYADLTNAPFYALLRRAATAPNAPTQLCVASPGKVRR